MEESKFELVINAQTARMLGFIISWSLLASADKLIGGDDANFFSRNVDHFEFSGLSHRPV